MDEDSKHYYYFRSLPKVKIRDPVLKRRKLNAPPSREGVASHNAITIHLRSVDGISFSRGARRSNFYRTDPSFGRIQAENE